MAASLSPGLPFRAQGSDDASDPFVSPTPAPNNHRYSTFDSQVFAMTSGSADQAKRVLEAHLAETDRRMEEAGKLGTSLVQQRRELEERLREVEKLQAEEELTPDLKQKLAGLEKDYNEVARESARAFLPKPRVPSNEATGSPFAPQGKGGRRSVSPSKFESQATGSPTKLSVPNRKLRNQPQNRVHDIEFAAEISTSLISQVRNLQTLLTEREEELRDIKMERSKLEIEAEGFEQRLKTLDESEHRYKDENWNLETQIHELIASQKEAADREKKLTSTLTALQAEKVATQRDLDEIKMTHAKLADEHAAVVKSHDIELGTAKRNIAMAESERAAMHRKIEDLTSQNTELAKAFSLQRGRALDRDHTSGMSDEDFETATDNITPEHSPPPSPVKGTPRHSMLESETLKTSLHHAQRTIQSLRTNVHREKTEKLELKRMLQDARDELEKARSDPSATSRRSRKVDSREFKKPLRSSQLGGARSSRTDLYVEDAEWEENGEVSPTRSRVLRPSTSRGSDLDAVGESTDHFETANETSDAAFETAHERGTETDDFHTGAEEFSDDDDAATETESVSRGAGTIRRPPILPLNQPGNRYSFMSTASTSNDEEEFSYQSEMRTPTAAPAPQKMRIRVNRGSAISRRSRQASEEPTFQSSPISFANSSATGTPQAGGQSLFAELGDFEGSDEESFQATPSRRSTRSFTPGSTFRGRTASPPPELPALPRVFMVDSGMMTDPVEFHEGRERPLSMVSNGVGPDASTQWLDVMDARDGDRSRPLSMLSYSDASAQHDPDMEKKLAQFPPPPTSPPRFGLMPMPILPPPQSLGMSNIQSEHIEPVHEPVVPLPAPPALGLSTISSEYVEPQAELEIPPPTLSLSTIQREHVEPVAEPEVPPPAPPTLTISTISGETVEPVAEPEPVVPKPPTLGFTSIRTEHVEPKADAPIVPSALSLSTIRGEHVEPVAEPEVPAAIPAAALVTERAVEKPAPPVLSISSIHAEALEPVAEPPAVAPAPPALTYTTIKTEDVEPKPEPEIPTPPPPALSWSSIHAENVEPRADVPPALSHSTILAQEVAPVSEPDVQRLQPQLGLAAVQSIETTPIEFSWPAESKQPEPELDYSTIQWVGTEPVEPRSPRRNGFILPRDADSPQETRPKTPSHAVFGSPLARGKGKAPSTPIIAEDDTRQSPSDTPLSDTPESQRPFKEISTNSYVKPMRKQPVPTTDQGAQTSLTAEQLDALLAVPKPAGVFGHQRIESLGSSMGTPGTVRHNRRRSQDSVNSVIRHKVLADDIGSETAAEATLRRPGSSSSIRTAPPAELPPLPPNHREVIEAARTGSGHGPSAPGSMGPPLFPASAYKNPAFRPNTPSIQKPMSPVSGRGTPTPRAGRGNSAHGTAEIHSPSRHTARSRRSSVSSFVSELDNRFNLHPGIDPGSFYGSNTDPRMIQAITQTMIGENLWKYTRKAGRGEMSDHRHQRYFWIHPYTRTLYWSDRDPFTSPGEKSKSVPIEAVRVVTDDNPNPPGLHRKSLVIISRGRTIKMTCHTSQRHETWFNALSYLLQRNGEEGQNDAEEMAGSITREDVEEFNPGYGRRAAAGTRSRVAPSLSSYNSRTTRNESPAFDVSMSQPTLTPNHKKSASERPAMGTLGRLSGVWRSGSKISGTFNSLRGRRGSTQGQQSQIYEASEAFDSAEDLRQIYEQQDREADRLENVRACCDGKHDVGTLGHSHRRGRRAHSSSSNSHVHGGPSTTSTPMSTVRSKA